MEDSSLLTLSTSVGGEEETKASSSLTGPSQLTTDSLNSVRQEVTRPGSNKEAANNTGKAKPAVRPVTTPEPGPNEQRLDGIDWIDYELPSEAPQQQQDNQDSPTNHKTATELMQEMFDKRQEFAMASQKLFAVQQEFNKKIEDLKKHKASMGRRREDYIDKMTLYALRDGELRYQKEQLLYAEESWSEMVDEKQRHIAIKRRDLESALGKYREARQRISVFQERLNYQTEERRINTLNSIAFVNYAKTLIEHEVRKQPEKKLLPSKKAIQRTKSEYLKRMERAKQELKKFYVEKILEFRRHERILLGRTKDMSEYHAQLKGSILNNNGPLSVAQSTAAVSNTADLLHDSLEHRVAEKLFAMTEGVKDTFGTISDDEDHHPHHPPPQRNANSKLPQLGNTAEGKTHRSNNNNSNNNTLNNTTNTNNNNNINNNNNQDDKHHQRKHNHQLTSQQVDVLLFDKTANYESNTKRRGQTPQTSQKRMHHSTDKYKEWTGYDPEMYFAACAGDYIRPHSLLDTNRGIGEREEHLCNIGYLCSHARGKLTQLTAIRDGLDMELAKQAALLLTVVDTIDRSFGKSTASQSPHRPSSHTLNLPSSCRMDYMQRNEEIRRIQERIFNILQPHAPKIR